MPRILIIDDEEGVRLPLAHHFSSRGWDALTAEDGLTGIQLTDEHAPDLILLDVRLPDRGGLDVLRALRENGSGASVVIMTGWGTIENAVEAIKLGAEQYLTKPVDLVELDALADRIMENRKLLIENLYYRERMDHPVVGLSLAAHRLHHTIDLMAENANTTVLLMGESGTGKELIAREIHRRGPRRERPFLDVNCAAFPENLMENELFGHERGAFTGAHELKRGLLEVADGGTLFLDEIGEMPLQVQPKLLRVLEGKRFKRVGGTREVRVDVRIIAATNRDLAKGVKEGLFREDLYYRLSVFPVTVPPLRDRAEDVPALSAYFLTQFNMTLNRNVSGFTREAMDVMVKYPWPGNVRELRNMVERAVVLSRGGVIDTNLLPREVAGSRGGGRLRRNALPENDAVPRTLEELEKDHIRHVLTVEKGNRSRAARVLGISRSTLLEKMKKYGVP
jgi:DNA-binding NtrC family response regulator